MPMPASQAEHQLVERTAAFVAANGEQVLGQLLHAQGDKLVFLRPAHPLHAYFCLRMRVAQRAGGPPSAR